MRVKDKKILCCYIISVLSLLLLVFISAVYRKPFMGGFISVLNFLFAGFILIVEYEKIADYYKRNYYKESKKLLFYHNLRRLRKIIKFKPDCDDEKLLLIQGRFKRYFNYYCFCLIHIGLVFPICVICFS